MPILTKLHVDKQGINFVPQFPEFRRVLPEDRAAYQNFYRHFNAYSDFSFNNLWVWFNHGGDLAFSRDGKNLIIRFDNTLNDGEEAYTLLGRSGCRRTIERLLEWQSVHGLKECLLMVPEQVLRSIRRPSDSSLSIEEDRDNYDYVYELEKLVDRRGGQYASYRYSVLAFQKRYADCEARYIDITDISQCTMLINRLHSWDKPYNDSQQALTEGKTLNRYLLGTAGGNIQAQCLGIFVNGILQAFVIYQFPGQKDYVIANHLKYNRDFKFIFDGAFNLLFHKLYEQGYKYINLEQDLGIEGMRAHKLELRPDHYLRRYTIRPSNTD